jgi:hypothetical protein
MTILWSLPEGGAHPRPFTEPATTGEYSHEFKARMFCQIYYFISRRNLGESSFFSPGTAKNETPASDFA